MTTVHIQNRIISVLVTDLLAAGFAIDVNDNDADRETHYSGTDHAQIMKAIFNSDIDAGDYCLDIFKAGNGHHVGWVRLIDGNGASVISDYAIKLEPYMKNANALANKIDGHEEEFLEKEFRAGDAMLAALHIAEGFMSGFEGDEHQDGIDAMLATIRAAIALAEGNTP